MLKGGDNFVTFLLLPAAAMMGMLCCGCTCSGGGDAAQTQAEPPPTTHSSAQPGTVLRIVCDIPDDVGPVARTYPGRIDWPGGSERFSFTLSKESFDVQLKNAVPAEEIVRIFFIVDEDPPFPTKFRREEWYWRGRLRPDENEPGEHTFRVCLSRFRGARRHAYTVRPDCDGHSSVAGAAPRITTREWKLKGA